MYTAMREAVCKLPALTDLELRLDTGSAAAAVLQSLAPWSLPTLTSFFTTTPGVRICAPRLRSFHACFWGTEQLVHLALHSRAVSGGASAVRVFC
jgi:hypothetical protein